MKYCVDEARCTGHGRCYTIAPEVYSADEDGFNAVRGTATAVAPEQEGAAELGARACPEQAIEIVR